MKTRVLGRTGLSVSELALGTWGLSGEPYAPVTADETNQVISRSAEMGVNLFDTAHSYGLRTGANPGSMEQALGEILGQRSDVVVVTRVGTDREASPPRKRFDVAYLRAAIEKSRERLGDVKLIALLHNPSTQALATEEPTDLLRTLEAEGLIQSWGVSTPSEACGARALDLGAPVLSVPHNIFHVQPLLGLAERLRAAGTGVLAHSILSYGLLAGRWPATKVFPLKDHRNARWPDGALRRRVQQLDAVRPLVSGDVTSMRAAAVRFVLANDLVSSAILGPRSGVQLDQLVRDARCDGPYLSEPKLSALESRLTQVGAR